MRLDERTLKNLIARANPEQAVKRFKTGGTCGNEGVLRFCQVFQSAGVTLQEVNPYLLAWFNHWRKCLTDETGAQWEFEDIEIMADETWGKVKYGGKDRFRLATERAAARVEKYETICNLEGYGAGPEQLLALTCYELSRMESPFYISERQAAEILGLDCEGGRRKARTTLKVFCKRRVLLLVKKGNQVLSTRYKYTGYPPKSVPESQKNPEKQKNPDETRRHQRNPDD